MTELTHGNFEHGLTLFNECAIKAETPDEIEYVCGNLSNAAGRLIEKDGKNAVRCFELALRHIQRIEDPEKTGFILSNLGIAYREVGCLKESITYLTKARILLKSSPDLEATVLAHLAFTESAIGLADTWWKAAWMQRKHVNLPLRFELLTKRLRTLTKLQHINEAVELLLEGADEDWETSQRVLLADSLCAAARLFEGKFNWPKIRDLWTKALTGLPNEVIAGERREYLLEAGVAHRRNGDAGRALPFLRRAVQLFPETDPANRARCIGNLGNALLELTRYTEASDCFREAVQLYRGIQNSEGLAASLGNLAICICLAGKSTGEAISLITQATIIHENRGDHAAAGYCWLNLMLLLSRCSECDHGEVIAAGRRAVTSFCRAKMDSLAADCLCDLAQLSLEDDLDGAEEHLRRHGELSLAKSNEPEPLRVVLLRSDIALRRAKYGECLLLLDGILSSKLLVNWRLHMSLFMRTGAALIGIGSLFGAKKVYNFMREIAKEDAIAAQMNHIGGGASALGAIGLGVCALTEDDFQGAAKFFEDAASTIEGLHGLMLRTNFTVAMAARCRTFLCQLLEDQATALHRNHNFRITASVLKLLTTFPGIGDLENSHAKLASQLKGPVEQQLLSASGEQKAEWIYYDARLFWPVYNFAIEHVEIRHSQKAAFCTVERARSRNFTEEVFSRDSANRLPGLSGVVIAHNTLDFDNIMSPLSSYTDTAVISFFIGEEQSVVWVTLLSAEPSLKMFFAPRLSRDSLHQLAESTWAKPRHESLTGGDRDPDKPQPAMDKLLGDLYRLLFEGPRCSEVNLIEFVKNSGRKRLVIIPHDRLHCLPVHAARDGAGNYLCDQFDVCYSPSVKMIHRNLDLDRRWGERILVVANPDGSLKGPKREVEIMRSLFRVPVVLGPGEASVGKVLDMLHEAEVLHFSCHGTLSNRGMEFSGLGLSNDEFLSVRTLIPDGKDYHRKPYGPHLRLVFLAACESALDNWKPYEEPLSMATAFMACGSPTVIATLWTVEDVSTAEFVRTFYSHARKPGTSVGAAFRLAQFDLRKSWPHPWHWAPFALFGSWT